jgi:hypothetical protein
MSYVPPVRHTQFGSVAFLVTPLPYDPCSVWNTSLAFHRMDHHDTSLRQNRILRASIQHVPTTETMSASSQSSALSGAVLRRLCTPPLDRLSLFKYYID